MPCPILRMRNIQIPTKISAGRIHDNKVVNQVFSTAPE